MSDAGEEEPVVVVERRSGGGIGVFLLGVALGAGLALLYAPQAGDETRAALRRGTRRLRRRVRDLSEDVKEVAQDFARSPRDSARAAREAIEARLARHHRTKTDAEDALGDDDSEDSGV